MRRLSALQLQIRALLDGIFNPNLEQHTFTYDPMRWTSDTMRSNTPLDDKEREKLFGSSDKLIKEFFGDDSMMKFTEPKFPKEGDPNFDFSKTEGSDENSTWKEEIATSKDGSQTFKRKTVTGKGPKVKEPTLEELKTDMEKAVKEQRFEDAAKLRDQISKMKNNGTQRT